MLQRGTGMGFGRGFVRWTRSEGTAEGMNSGPQDSLSLCTRRQLDLLPLQGSLRACLPLPQIIQIFKDPQWLYYLPDAPWGRNSKAHFQEASRVGLRLPERQPATWRTAFSPPSFIQRLGASLTQEDSSNMNHPCFFVLIFKTIFYWGMVDVQYFMLQVHNTMLHNILNLYFIYSSYKIWLYSLYCTVSPCSVFILNIVVYTF